MDNYGTFNHHNNIRKHSHPRARASNYPINRIKLVEIITKEKNENQFSQLTFLLINIHPWLLYW